jgi:hypothetical protein
MTKNKADKIVLGHNGFFGVDHLSASRGQQRANYFQKTERIVEMVQVAHECDVHGMMMSTHARASEVLELLRKRPALTGSLRIYPLLPYAQKYVIAANQKGIFNAISDALSGATGGAKLKMLWNGAKGIVGKDLRSILSSLIQMELLPFKGFETPFVFLHDAFTDLALALDLKNIFEFYIEEIATNYQAEAAFTTKNLPLFLEKFGQYGLGTPLVMTHVNACGFSMNPSREAVEESLSRLPARVMAMSTLASGHLEPDEAFEYLGTVSGIESVVVGASTKEHILSTVDAIRTHMFIEETDRRVKIAV